MWDSSVMFYVVLDLIEDYELVCYCDDPSTQHCPSTRKRLFYSHDFKSNNKVISHVQLGISGVCPRCREQTWIRVSLKDFNSARLADAMGQIMATLKTPEWYERIKHHKITREAEKRNSEKQ